MNQKVLTRYLKQAGYFYQTANNGLEAIEKYKAFKFDLIFMDVVMPEMSGIEATQKIREMEKASETLRTPIIGLSGNAGIKHSQEALNAGMDGYLNKPYRKDEIYQVIQEKLNTQPLTSPTLTKMDNPGFVFVYSHRNNLSSFFTQTPHTQAKILETRADSPPVSMLGS